MSLETEGSQSTDSAATTESTSIYSVVDPGATIESLFPSETETTDTTNETPSETSDDASEGETTETEEQVSTETLADESVDSVDDDGLSDELIDRAFALGYTVDDLKEVKDAKALEREIGRVERLNARLKAKPSDSEEQTPPENGDDADKEPDWEAMVEQGHDPDVIALNRRMWQRAQQAEAKANQLLQAEQNRVLEAQSLRFDAALNSMEDLSELFGSGTKAELDKASPTHAQNRQKVFTKMNALRLAYQAANLPIPSETELIEEAVHASFYKQIQKTARETLKKDIRKNSSQSLTRARTTKTTELTGPDKALEIERNWRKEHGLL